MLGFNWMSIQKSKEPITKPVDVEAAAADPEKCSEQRCNPISACQCIKLALKILVLSILVGLIFGLVTFIKMESQEDDHEAMLHRPWEFFKDLCDNDKNVTVELDVFPDNFDMVGDFPETERLYDDQLNLEINETERLYDDQPNIESTEEQKEADVLKPCLQKVQQIDDVEIEDSFPDEDAVGRATKTDTPCI